MEEGVFLARALAVGTWTETYPQRFSFSLLSKFPDPFRRQISEALHIIEMGDLNRKKEFNTNEICHM